MRAQTASASRSSQPRTAPPSCPRGRRARPRRNPSRRRSAAFPRSPRARAANRVEHEADAGHQKRLLGGLGRRRTSWRGPLGLGGDRNRTLAGHCRPPYPMPGALLDERGRGAAVAEAIDVPATRPGVGVRPGPGRGRRRAATSYRRAAAVEDLVGCALLDDLSAHHHVDVVGDVSRAREVVRDVEERDLLAVRLSSRTGSGSRGGSRHRAWRSARRRARPWAGRPARARSRRAGAGRPESSCGYFRAMAAAGRARPPRAARATARRTWSSGTTRWIRRGRAR